MTPLCIRCKTNSIKPTFSFYCRRCYKYLDVKYKLTIEDYTDYFELTYRCNFTDEFLSFYRLTDLHNYFKHSLQITNKSLSQMLEIILCVKADTARSGPIPGLPSEES